MVVRSNPISLQVNNNNTGLSALAVYVGYANTTNRAGIAYPQPGWKVPPGFPSPWAGDANIIYDGKPWPDFFDAGAVMLKNTSTSAVTVTSVSVDLPGTECSDYGCRPVHWDLWQKNRVIPPGWALILTQPTITTIPFPILPNASVAPNLVFDPSDWNVFPHNMCDLSRWLPMDHHDPLLTVTSNGSWLVFDDRGHKMDWGGADFFFCQPPLLNTECVPWTLVSPATSQPSVSSLSLIDSGTFTWGFSGMGSSGNYYLAPTASSLKVGLLQALTVTAKTASGATVNDVVVAMFSNTDGVHIGSAKTFGNGTATIYFAPRAAGTYRITANYGGLRSNAVTVVAT